MRKIASSVIIIITGLAGVYFGVALLQNILLRSSFESEYISSDEPYIVRTELQRCSLNIFMPEVARVTEFEDRKEKRISFYRPTRMFFQTNEEWSKSRTGGTTVKNTTFPELVKMVKEDCSQFQEGGRQGETEWIHTPAPTRDEIKKDKIDFLERIFYGLGSRANEKFIEIYGDINNMTDEEKVKLRDEIEEKGLDPAVENLRQVEETRRGLAELTDNQQKAIRQKYGDWKGLSDDELLEWMKIIDKDYEEGKFNLDDY